MMWHCSLQAGTSYKHTVNFKLQRAILTTVTVLISKVQFCMFVYLLICLGVYLSTCGLNMLVT